jgi:glycosyltransferase involved in cell wall biosynthesis
MRPMNVNRGCDRPRLKVAAVTGGLTVPSACYRVRQYIPKLADAGIAIEEFYARAGAYPPAAGIARPFWGLSALVERSFQAARTHRHDVTLLQREMISTLYSLEGFLKRPLVFDFDDAIFLYRGGRVLGKILGLADQVICGNPFLAEHIERYRRTIHIIPTAVDTDRYRWAPLPDTRTIGWSGTSGGFKFLYGIEGSLKRLLDERKDARLVIVSDAEPRFATLNPDRYSFVRWDRRTEPDILRTFSVGIMPLEDDLWSRGKCSYKMLLYMACGIPVVVSPVGMNADVLARGEAGLAARNADQWHEAIDTLLTDRILAGTMGRKGREIVEEHYSVAVIAPKLAAVLNKYRT